jgi:hypothetical protein
MTRTEIVANLTEALKWVEEIDLRGHKKDTNTNVVVSEVHEYLVSAIDVLQEA